MAEVKDNNTYNVEREICPQITTPKDIIDRIGILSVDILNKDKNILKLWGDIDILNGLVITLGEEIKALKEDKIQYEGNSASQDSTIEQLRSNKQIVEKTFHDDTQRLKEEHQSHINNKNNEIQGLEKTLKSIEAEAVVNQEEVRKELMETQNELFSLKESLKPPKKVTKKKKTNAKPARA